MPALRLATSVRVKGSEQGCEPDDLLLCSLLNVGVPRVRAPNEPKLLSGIKAHFEDVHRDVGVRMVHQADQLWQGFQLDQCTVQVLAQRRAGAARHL